MKTLEILPGDIIIMPTGINREPTKAVIHSIHRYDTGDLSTRWRYADNPRGVDWSGFIKHDETEITLVARGVAQIDTHTRSMLP